MAERRKKTNMSAENHSSRKPLVVAVSVICALVVVIIAFLACKNPIYFSIAKSKAEKGDYSAAMELCQKTTDEKNAVLGSYLELRFSINEVYPRLLSEFDINIINEWYEKTLVLSESSGILGQTLNQELVSLMLALDQISNGYGRYLEIRPEVLSVMDIFAEFNRLYTVGPDGKNTAFTVAEERIKIAAWEQQNANLSAYASTVAGSENIYLLNYLIKEIQGECGDLREAMDSVIAMGYKETDNIRLSGTAQKKFPGIQNSNNESVTVLDKERYEAFMFESICYQLVQNLGRFYNNSQ